ncbi:Serine/threonine-protein kinase PknL [Phaeobacter inhibens]|uniref:protein kinase domain-containing protein n=1 Tax=Phaeobacter inhibens TaxID=221822 RepID=UPI000CA106C9|nr:SIR2 family protein [Phaeobacter inhibens]AUQ58892.1 Serine/threonine-protein kinase PknL [Phaeobacter inhibens]
MPYDHTQANLNTLCKRYAEASKRTVFFVGAGGSSEVGIPTWGRLAEKLFQQIDEVTPASAMDGKLLAVFHEFEASLNSGDYWKLFELAEKHWHQVYEDFLAAEFSDEVLENCDIPRSYIKMWKMRNVGQIATLNIDGLLRRAYDSAFGTSGAKIFEFPGTSVIDSKSYVARNFPVLLHLHGVYTSRSTWVMNKSERDRLFNSFDRGDYRAFVRNIFENYNIVFVGVNIMDGAISPIIEEISNAKLLQDHYWITPEISPDAYKWAQSVGVRVINYSPETGEKGKKVHTPVICSILDDIEAYQSHDEKVVLPQRERPNFTSLPKSADLLQQIALCPLDAARSLDGLFEAIGQDHGFDGKQMSGLIREFEVPLELCSILGSTEPYNSIGSATITAKVSASNSSNVWLALQDDGKTACAVKALSGQALKDDIERSSFRRGVESLYLLNRENRKVAPTYLFHTNVPMAVAMEFVEGASLADHMTSAKKLVQESWLEVCLGIGKSLLACHKSEGGVLHRDLKPQNIIFEGAYEGCEAVDLQEANVRFINFDMSWHKLSAGNTKSISADDIGYYAPEQRNLANADSPRTAKTDVYMFGMTILFILSGISPPDGGAQRENWQPYISSKVKARLQEQLISERVSRLILKMTSVDPDARPDLRSVLTELEMISSALSENWIAVDPDFFVEKIMCGLGYDYEWDEGAIAGRIKTPRLIELSLSYVPKGQLLVLSFMRQRDDGADRKNFGGKLGKLVGQVNQTLKGQGWQTEEGGGHHSRSIEARVPIRELVSNPDKSIDDMRRIISSLMATIG